MNIKNASVSKRICLRLEITEISLKPIAFSSTIIIPLQNTMFSDAMQDSTQRKNAIRAGLYDVHARYVAIQTKLCYTENIRTEKDGR